MCGTYPLEEQWRRRHRRRALVAGGVASTVALLIGIAAGAADLSGERLSGDAIGAAERFLALNPPLVREFDELFLQVQAVWELLPPDLAGTVVPEKLYDAVGQLGAPALVFVAHWDAHADEISELSEDYRGPLDELRERAVEYARLAGTFETSCQRCPVIDAFVLLLEADGLFKSSATEDLQGVRSTAKAIVQRSRR